MSIILSVYSEAGEWTVQSVLGGNDLTSDNYQEKYQSLHKTRTWWKDQLTDYPTEKEIQLQIYIQSLHQDLQVSHQTKISLQEALVEANKQGIYTNTLTDYYYVIITNVQCVCINTGLHYELYTSLYIKCVIVHHINQYLLSV